MAKSKSRGKPYDPNKAKKAAAKKKLKNKVVTFLTGDKVNYLYCLNTHKRVDVTLDLAQQLSKDPYTWSVYVAVFCRDQLGQEYMKSDSHLFTTRYRQLELVPYLNEEHNKLIKTVNRDHVIGAGWIASHEGRDFSETEAAKLFENMGCWDAYRDPDTSNIYCLDQESA